MPGPIACSPHQPHWIALPRKAALPLKRVSSSCCHGPFLTRPLPSFPFFLLLPLILDRTKSESGQSYGRNCMPCIHLAALSWNFVLVRVSIAVRTTMTISNLGGKGLFCYTCTYSLHKGSPGRNLEVGQRLWRGALRVSSLSQSDS